jgi:hypothetical protein
MAVLSMREVFMESNKVFDQSVPEGLHIRLVSLTV